jgi:type IV pilus assembly protein PilO
MASLGIDKLTVPAKFLIGFVLVALIAGGYYVVFYGELATKIDNARAQEQQLQRDLADARQNEQLYQKDLAELTDRQQRQNQLAKVLPSSTEYPAFLSSVQTVANVSGIALTSWAPEPESAEQFYARVPMNVSLEGRFHQIAKFFYGVGQLDRIINMENISITTPRLVDKAVNVKVTALATAFRALNANDRPEVKRPGAAR